LRFEQLEARSAPSVVPVGGEFRINTYTNYNQNFSRVAMDAAGDFISVWQSQNQDGSIYGVYAQRFSAGGVAQGPEFRVNTFTTGHQERPAVAMDAAGDFVIAWDSGGNQDGSGYGVYAKRYNATGVELSPPPGEPIGLGNEFRVNSFTTGSQRQPAVAMDTAGDFVIAWSSQPQDGDAIGIYAKRYGATGASLPPPAGVPLGLGNEFRVNTFTVDIQDQPSVAMDTAGDFVIAWDSNLQDGSGIGVYEQHYSAAGVPLGGEFRVNTTTIGNQWLPAVAMGSAGNFVVAWESFGQDGSDYGVYAQRYSSAGVPQSGEFQVNTFTTGHQGEPAAVTDAAGDFLIAWESVGQDGSGVGVYVQTYLNDGSPDGGEFRVNSYTTGNQFLPSVGMDGAGDIAVAWTSAGQDGSGYGVYAQRYQLADAPKVADIVIDNGAAQRSRVTDLTVTFSTQVSFATTPAAAFALARISDGASVSFSTSSTVINGVTVITLNGFGGLASNAGSLADGRYTLRVWASQVSAGGQPLDGNGDGTGGDDFVLVGTPTNGLFRLFGDANGDGTVSASDFIQFRLAFGGSGSIFDFDGDGAVAASDFIQFRLRFGGSI
jgi:hypothetical protein